MNDFKALYHQLHQGVQRGVLTPSEARARMKAQARQTGVALPKNLASFAHDDWRKEVADIRREIAAKR